MTSENGPVTAENGRLSPETLAELHRLAGSRPRSGRGQLAKLGALRTLERLNRKAPGVPPVPEGWHPGPDEFRELDRVWLDEHPAVRQRWWEQLYWQK